MKFRMAVLMLCAAALAEGAAQAEETSEREARALFAEGNQLVIERDFAGALDRFQKAHALLPNPKILLNIGTMLRELGHEAEAANAYSRYLEDPGADPQRRAEVEALLRELDQHVGRLRILVTEAGGRVLIDGHVVGEAGSPILVRVTPGEHHVTFERAGRPPAAETFAIAAGAERELSFAQGPALPPASVEEPAARSKPEAGNIQRPRSVAAPTAPRTIASRTAGAQRDEADPKEGERRFHAGQLGAVVRTDIDSQGLGMATALGLSYGLSRVDIGVSALLSKEKGVEPSATIFLLDTSLKPLISVAVPIFFVDGARPGVRGAAGLQWDPFAWIGVFGSVSVAHFPDVPDRYDNTVILYSLGIQPRL